LSIDDTRLQPEAGPQERLSKTGNNLANVIQFLKEQHPQRLESIFSQLRHRIPRIESVVTESMPDGRLLLEIKDAPFEHPILAKFTSDGTLKMLAYLLVLNDPEPPAFIGIEEPENFLHPRLLEEVLRVLLPKVLGSTTFEVYRSQCKDELLSELRKRLQGYASWLPESYRVLVLLDQDRMEAARAISPHMEPMRNQSPSFRALHHALREIAGT